MGGGKSFFADKGNAVPEFPVVKQSLLEGKRPKQIEAAKLMKISRSTFSRIITSAHRKIADGLVNIKAIRIEGGCCSIIKKRRKGES